MEEQKREDIFYSLCIEDIQTVAFQEIERELTDEELEIIKDAISKRIDWHEAIADSIIDEELVV